MPAAHPPANASLVVIGDEILDGHTRDTNSGWLAERLSAAGVGLERIVTVPDDDDAIAEAVGTELARPRPRIVFTSGGLGSTPDDRTMAALAAFLDRDLVADPELDARVSRWAEHAAAEDGAPIPAEQVAAMRRMAFVPAGSHLLPATRGVTPGVALDLEGGVELGGATIVVLPGVPGEFRRIVDASVVPLLERVGGPTYVRELTHPYPESVLAPLLGELEHEHPSVAIGSYPGRECLLRVKGPVEAVDLVERRLRDRLAELAADPTAGRLSARWQARWE